MEWEFEVEKSNDLIKRLHDDLFAEMHVIWPIPRVEFNFFESLGKREALCWRCKAVGMVRSKAKVGINELEASLKRQWGNSMEAKFSLTDQRLIMVATTSLESLVKIVEDGCLTFRGSIIMLNKWDPTLFHQNEFTGSFDSTPVWLKGLGIPESYMNDVNLDICATPIGVATAFESIAMEIHGADFMRVRVMIDLNALITRSVVGNIKNYSLDEYKLLSAFNISIYYDHIPPATQRIC